MVHIVTVHYNTPRFIELCIKAVHLYATVPYEHVVIDTGSRAKSLAVLKRYHKWVTLIRRREREGPGAHARSIDWFLNGRRNLNMVCLLDSDAFPTQKGWLKTLLGRIHAGADATGFAHFRNKVLLHPACMLFKHSAYVKSGRPSFRIVGLGKSIEDTGMVVCEEMKKHGFKLDPINMDGPAYRKRGFSGRMIEHRWCATRITRVPKNGKLDGKIPRENFERNSDSWFKHPAVKKILRHDLCAAKKSLGLR